MAIKTHKDTSKVSSNQSQLASMYRAVESLAAMQRLVESPEWKEHLLPLLKAMLIKEWLQPSDFPSSKRFLEAYYEALAEVKIAKKFLAQFSPLQIDEQIKSLRKQIIRIEANA